jgi:hypothetical protein
MKMKRQSILAVLMLGLITTSGCASHCAFDLCKIHKVHTGSQPTMQTAHRPYQNPQSGVGASHTGKNGRR